MNTIAETINAAGFGTAFHIRQDGTCQQVADYPEDCVNAVGDRYGDPSFEGIEEGYSPVYGLTGQYGCGGPVMHESEVLVDDTIRRILESIGECVIYLAGVADCMDYPEDESDDAEPGEIYGWMVLTRPATDYEIY